MYKDRPYLDEKTNILSLTGQLIVVMSFLSALLMRVDLEGEAFTVDMVGFIILAMNVPMMGYLIYVSTNDEFCIKNEEFCIQITQKRGILY